MGDFSQEVTALNNPFTGGIYPGARLTPNASAAALLSLFPNPNLHVGESTSAVLNEATPYNYIANKRTDINSNQYDLRADQNFGARATAFARYTNKSIGQTQPESLNIPNGTAFATYRIFAASVSYAVTRTSPTSSASASRWSRTAHQPSQRPSPHHDRSLQRSSSHLSLQRPPLSRLPEPHLRFHQFRRVAPQRGGSLPGLSICR